MNPARKRISTFLLHLPFRMPSLPDDGDEQQERQQLGLKYTGIPFGDPSITPATGRKVRLLKRGCLMSLQRGL